MCAGDWRKVLSFSWISVKIYIFCPLCWPKIIFNQLTALLSVIYQHWPPAPQPQFLCFPFYKSVCVCVCLCRGLFEFPAEFGPGFVIRGWTVDPGEDREGKRMQKRRRMSRRRRKKKVGRMPDSQHSESEVEDLEGRGITRSQCPATIQELWLMQKKKNNFHGSCFSK